VTSAGSTQTKDLGGSDAWFQIDSITNSEFPTCAVTSVMYSVSSTDDTAHTGLANSAAPTPSGTIYQATPINTNLAQTYLFTLKVNVAGGSIARFDYTLIIVCGPTTASLLFTQDPAFVATHTLYLSSGITT